MNVTVSVSQAVLVVGETAEQPIRDALASIDTVHQDGRLPVIRAHQRIFRAGEGEGVYARNKATQEPLAILINADTLIPRFTFVHEVGHFLDHQAIDRRGVFASESSPRMLEWKKAVSQSHSYLWLQDLAGYEIASVDFVDGTSQRHTIRHKYREYLLQDRELFARSYAQYVTERCHNEKLKAEMEAVRQKPLEEVYRRQWTDIDFGPIGAALDGVFKDLGWLL